MVHRQGKPEAPPRSRIAIVGDGHAAAALLLQLHERGVDPEGIHVYGPDDGELGAGAAFGTGNPCYRLNIRADLMSIRPEGGEAFAEWAEASTGDGEAATDAGMFHRRGDFARFTRDTLERCPGSKGWRRTRGTVAGLGRGPDDGSKGVWRLSLDDGTAHMADSVVLATGNPLPAPTFPVDPDSAHLLEATLWRGDWPGRLAGGESIAIVGGGLTAMDALLALHQAGHEGRIRVVAPFHAGAGALPPRQAGWGEAWEVDAAPPRTAGALLEVFRRTLPRADWESAEWQCAFEGLRAWLPPVWQALPRTERLRAVRRLSGPWQHARYRASPQTAGAAEDLGRQGRLELARDRVAAMAEDGGRARLDLASGKRVLADRVLLATGAGGNPLAAAMKGGGLIPEGMLGFEVDRDFRVLDSRWRGRPGLYALGPPTAFSRGDVVGASTVAKEAAALADRLAGGAT